MSSQLPSKTNVPPAQNGRTMPERNLVAPETLNGIVDYKAFSSTDHYGRHLLIPNQVLHEIRDQSSVEIRRAAISTIQKTILETDNREQIEGSLEQILNIVNQALSDSNFKIVLIALQLVDDIITKVGLSLLPFLPTLLSNYLSKAGSHKNMVKQAGMKVLMNLISTLSPAPVISEIIKVGLASKQAKVREESLNIITASLLSFSKSEFDLLSLVDGVTPLLVDVRNKVRQACLECCAVLADRLGKEYLQSLVSAVISVERSTITSSQNELAQLNLMLAFQTRLSRNQLPSLNEHGLVDHVINVTNGKSNGSEWSGSDVDWILAGKGSSPGVVSRKSSGPLKSAGKKMPWESPSKDQQSVTGYTSLSLKQQQQQQEQMQKPLPLGLTSKTKGYLDIYKMSQEVKLSSRNIGKTSTLTHQAVLQSGACNGAFTDSLSTTWPRHNGHTNNISLHTSPTSRHISSENPTLGGNLVGSTKYGILPAIANSTNTTTSNNRPQSKPLVRNPLNFYPQLPPPPPPTTAAATSSPTAKLLLDSPTKIEESFLGSYGTDIDDDEEYFNNIPVDDSQLNCSLSSSLTSLLIGSAKETSTANDNTCQLSATMDSLSQIRKKAANWKAEVLSNHCSATTSPDNTPPLGHSHKFVLSNRTPDKNAVVSAPVSSTKETAALKKRGNPLKVNPFFHTPSSSTNAPPPLSLRPPLLYGSKSTGSTTTNEDDPSLLSYHQTTKQPFAANSIRDKYKLPFNSKGTHPPLAATRHGTLFVSPPENGLDTIPASLLPIKDLELNPDSLSPLKQNVAEETVTNNMSPNFPPTCKKKLSPAKATSMPKKSSFGIISNSAPVYRPGHVHETLREEDEEEEEEDSSHLPELSDLPHPESALRKVQEGLAKGGEEWKVKCEALFLLRRLTACHLEVLIPHLPSVLIAIEKEVKNIRSTVARSAIACLGDMFSFAPRYIEPSLDTITKTLLHVGSRANVFYREDVEKTLLEMCRMVSPAKSLQVLINGGLNHTNHLVRRQVAQFICYIVEYWEPSRIMRLPRDVLDRVFVAMSTLLEDADPLARYQARKMLFQLSHNPEFNLVASRSLSESQYTKMRDTAETLKLKGLGKPPLDSQSAKTTRLSLSSSFTGTPSTNTTTSSNTGNSPPKAPPKKRKVSTPQTDANSAPNESTVSSCYVILEKMKASDWKERQEAITQLDLLIQNHPNSLTPNMMIKIFDIFNERLNDNNSKVNLHALQTFQKIVPLISHHLQPVIVTIVEALAATVASRYTTIHTAAVDAIDTLIDNVDCTLLFSPFVSAAQNGNTRVQPIMLTKLSDLVPKVYCQKPSLVTRLGLPVLWKILSSRSPATGEAKMAVLRLCESLYSCLGSELITSANHLDPSQQQKLQELLDILSSHYR